MFKIKIQFKLKKLFSHIMNKEGAPWKECGKCGFKINWRQPAFITFMNDRSLSNTSSNGSYYGYKLLNVKLGFLANHLKLVVFNSFQKILAIRYRHRTDMNICVIPSRACSSLITTHHIINSFIRKTKFKTKIILI